jgi:hypothetical protein
MSTTNYKNYAVHLAAHIIQDIIDIEAHLYTIVYQDKHLIQQTRLTLPDFGEEFKEESSDSFWQMACSLASEYLTDEFLHKAEAKVEYLGNGVAEYAIVSSGDINNNNDVFWTHFYPSFIKLLQKTRDSGKTLSTQILDIFGKIGHGYDQKSEYFTKQFAFDLYRPIIQETIKSFNRDFKVNLDVCFEEVMQSNKQQVSSWWLKIVWN